MAKSGIGEQIIVLAIQQGPTKFDTSPQALIELKNAGLSDRVLSAMLVAPMKGRRRSERKRGCQSGSLQPAR